MKFNACFFPSKIVIFVRREKNVTEPDRPQMTKRWMRVTCCITKATDTHTKYVLFCTTAMVTRTDLYTTLYVQCLSGYIYNKVSYNWTVLYYDSLKSQVLQLTQAVLTEEVRFFITNVPILRGSVKCSWESSTREIQFNNVNVSLPGYHTPFIYIPTVLLYQMSIWTHR